MDEMRFKEAESLHSDGKHEFKKILENGDK